MKSLVHTNCSGISKRTVLISTLLNVSKHGNTRKDPDGAMALFFPFLYITACSKPATCFTRQQHRNKSKMKSWYVVRISVRDFDWYGTWYEFWYAFLLVRNVVRNLVRKFRSDTHFGTEFQ